VNTEQYEKLHAAKRAFVTDPEYAALLRDGALWDQIDNRTARIIARDPLAISDPLAVMRAAAEETKEWLRSIIPLKSSPPAAATPRRGRLSQIEPSATQSGYDSYADVAQAVDHIEKMQQRRRGVA